MKNYDFVFSLGFFLPLVYGETFGCSSPQRSFFLSFFFGKVEKPPTIEHINQPEFALKTLCFAGQQKFRVRCHLGFYAVCHFYHFLGESLCSVLGR